MVKGVDRVLKDIRRGVSALENIFARSDDEKIGEKEEKEWQGVE